MTGGEVTPFFHEKRQSFSFSLKQKNMPRVAFDRVNRHLHIIGSKSGRGICWSSLHRVTPAKSATKPLRGLLMMEKTHDDALLSFDFMI
jgi:hypothetical protein